MPEDSKQAKLKSPDLVIIKAINGAKKNQFKLFVALNIALLWTAMILNQQSDNTKNQLTGSQDSMLQQTYASLTSKQKDEHEKAQLKELKQNSLTDPGALLDLANAYFYGDFGAEKNKDRAVKLMRDSVLAGDARALYMLGNLYFAGDMGRTHTFDVAYALWTLALEGGYEDGRTNYENVLLNIINQGQMINGKHLLEQMRAFGVLEALDDYTLQNGVTNE
ncbi:MAG: hypothetical protein IBX55_01895 [Methyloprofundus sp.]|nr:hypothetical protein [Methyloprofundus sp.]